MEKRCPRCEVIKPIASFGVDNSKKSKRSPYCIECNAARRRDWYEANKTKARTANTIKSTTWLGREFEKPLTRNTAANRLIRAEVISTLGGKCACCGETTDEFLTIDHIHGGGGKHRKRTPGYFYRAIRREGCPTGLYRVLCYNCNCSLGHRGYCPHQGRPITLT